MPPVGFESTISAGERPKTYASYRAATVTGQLMLYREIMAVCSDIHTKHINTVCGQNVEWWNVKLVVHIVTNGRYI
jgi:hypothetical protein